MGQFKQTAITFKRYVRRSAFLLPSQLQSLMAALIVLILTETGLKRWRDALLLFDEVDIFEPQAVLDGRSSCYALDWGRMKTN